MKRSLALLFVFVLVLPLLCCGGPVAKTVALSDIGQDADWWDDVSDLFCNVPKSESSEEVYLGGVPLGITIDGDGVTVIGLNEFFNKQGQLCCPALTAGLQINDVILELDGRKIYGSARLSEIAQKSNGKRLSVKFVREGEIKTTFITPQCDLAAGQYRLGLWTRDSSGGIGTLTYTKKNLHFGSLGHPICDGEGNLIECKNGGVFCCTISGVERGKRGAAGELHGSFSFEKRLGNLYLNNKYGAFGTFTKLPAFCKELLPVADIPDVLPGKAEIYCTVSDTREKYQIEIVKVNRQTSKGDKGMVLRVTDERLLELTGGIVQGMSGSPIVQNGKLVGAVTHVFVNDPTRGYGIFAKWMMEN